MPFVDRPHLLIGRERMFRDRQIVDTRNRAGQREKVVLKRHEHTGRVGGYERTHQSGAVSARAATPVVTIELRAADFGMTREQLRAVVDSNPLVALRRITAAGLHLA